MADVYLFPPGRMLQAGRIADEFIGVARVLWTQPTDFGAKMKAGLDANDKQEIATLLGQAWNLRVVSPHMTQKRMITVAEKFAAVADRLNLLEDGAKLIPRHETHRDSAQDLELMGAPSLAKMVMIASW
jgi:hypothetical protein